jgi:hypothetical protein
MGESHPPTPPGIYCKNCRYELRGLMDYRCPECGQAYDPWSPATFTYFATRRAEIRHQVDRALHSVAGTAPGNPDLLIQLRFQIAKLLTENIELRESIIAIARILLDKKIISETELQKRLPSFGLFEQISSSTEEEILQWLQQSPDEPGRD